MHSVTLDLRCMLNRKYSSLFQCYTWQLKRKISTICNCTIIGKIILKMRLC